MDMLRRTVTVANAKYGGHTGGSLRPCIATHFFGGACDPCVFALPFCEVSHSHSLSGNTRGENRGKGGVTVKIGPKKITLLH